MTKNKIVCHGVSAEKSGFFKKNLSCRALTRVAEAEEGEGRVVASLPVGAGQRAGLLQATQTACLCTVTFLFSTLLLVHSFSCINILEGNAL